MWIPPADTDLMVKQAINSHRGPMRDVDIRNLRVNGHPVSKRWRGKPTIRTVIDKATIAIPILHNTRRVKAVVAPEPNPAQVLIRL